MIQAQSTTLGRTRRVAHLDEKQFMVGATVSAHQGGGATAESIANDLEAQEVAVEAEAAPEVTDIEHSVVETVGAHKRG